MVFETARLTFRRFLPVDFDDLYRLYSDPEIRKYFPDGVRNAKETREELEWYLNGHPDDERLGLWAAIEKSTGRFIGRCGLLPWLIDGFQEIEIAYMIHKDHWRQGFGSESAIGLVEHAHKKLAISKVIALIDPQHEASIRTAKSAGLTLEKQVVRDGLISDVYSRMADS